MPVMSDPRQVCDLTQFSLGWSGKLTESNLRKWLQEDQFLLSREVYLNSYSANHFSLHGKIEKSEGKALIGQVYVQNNKSAYVTYVTWAI